MIITSNLKIILSYLLIFNLTAVCWAEDIFDLSLEELANVSVISGLSRKEQSSFTATSANYVISQEDIRRSGLNSIPELLRMVPGMHVGQLNGNIWAINTRSPNERLSSELLVMIDGRNVYNSLFNGVYWDRIDTLVDDIERIEIIRGPGSSLWGSNASNGIINIVTKDANDTQGLLVSASTDTGQLDNEINARYGFSGENHDTRLYLKKLHLSSSTYPPNHDRQTEEDYPIGSNAHDGRKFWQVGFRSDLFLPSSQPLTIQGDYYHGEENETRVPFVDNTVKIDGYNLLTRYSHEINDESSVILQVYYDYLKAEDGFLTETKTWDIDLSHNFNLPRQEIIWGLAYRRINNDTEHTGQRGAFALSPAKRTTDTRSFFIEDEISLIEDTLSLEIGSKFEKNDFTGYEYQPNIKLAYQYNENTFFWASLSRALSVPSRIASDAYLDFNSFNSRCDALAERGFTNDPELGCIIDIGSEDVESSILYAKELGYRQKFNTQLSMDNTIFLHDYRVIDNDPSEVDLLWGYEVNINYQANKDWKLKTAWTYHRGKEVTLGKKSQNIPENSIFFSSYYNINEQLDLDLSYYYKSHTSSQKNVHQVDLRFAYRPSQSIELSLVGSNLFDRKHTEGDVDTLRANTNINRALMAKIKYTFE